MTCGFEDQSIDTGRFVLSRINNENYQFHHIRFDCIQGEQGELVFEPSDVEYYFEPVTIQESGTGNDSNLLIVFYVQIMPDDFVMQLHRF